jgi:hypothetical protein
MFWFGTSVPETTVSKHGNALATKHKIGFSKKSLPTSPACQAVLTKQNDQSQFGVAVALATDPRHDCAALFRCENVRHSGRWLSRAAEPKSGASSSYAFGAMAFPLLFRH